MVGKGPSMSPREFVSYKGGDDGGIEGYYAQNTDQKSPK